MHFHSRKCIWKHRRENGVTADLHYTMDINYIYGGRYSHNHTHQILEMITGTLMPWGRFTRYLRGEFTGSSLCQRAWNAGLCCFLWFWSKQKKHKKNQTNYRWRSFHVTVMAQIYIHSYNTLWPTNYSNGLFRFSSGRFKPYFVYITTPGQYHQGHYWKYDGCR